MRKNIHKSGNQFLRFGVQRGKETIGPDILKSFSGVKSLDSVLVLLKDVMPESKVRDVVVEFRSEAIKGETEDKYITTGKGNEQMTKGPDIFIFNPKEENESLEEDREKKQSAGITYVDFVNNGVDNIFENAEIMEKSAEEVGSIIGMLINNPIKEKKGEEKKEKDVFENELGDISVKHRYGDIRDSLVSFREKYKNAEKYYEGVKKLPKVKGNEQNIVNKIKVNVVESFAHAMFDRDHLKGITPAIEAGYERQKKIKLDLLKKKTLKKQISSL